MPTATSVARPSPRAAGPPLARMIISVLVVVAAAVMLSGGILSLLEEPERTDVTVDNPTAYPVHVRVESAEEGSGLGLGTAHSESSRTFTGVVDQGERWRFEFRYGGIDAAEVIVTRDDVAAGPIVVPSSAGRVLREAGVATPP